MLEINSIYNNEYLSKLEIAPYVSFVHTYPNTSSSSSLKFMSIFHKHQHFNTFKQSWLKNHFRQKQLIFLTWKLKLTVIIKHFRTFVVRVRTFQYKVWRSSHVIVKTRNNCKIFRKSKKLLVHNKCEIPVNSSSDNSPRKFVGKKVRHIGDVFRPILVFGDLPDFNQMLVMFLDKNRATAI